MVAHGGKVVYCSDSQEVADFVLSLAKEREAHLIVKSKSMTTEEIHFNERLEKHQLEAVETDLGEYISTSAIMSAAFSVVVDTETVLPVSWMSAESG